MTTPINPQPTEPTPMDPNRPAWRTTEGILTIITTLVGLLTSLGVLTLTDAATITDAVKQIGVAVGMLVAAGASLWKLIQARTELKMEVARQQGAMAQMAYRTTTLPMSQR